MNPAYANVLPQIYLQLQIYLACNDSFYPLFLWKKVGLQSTKYSPLLCCWFTEQGRPRTCEGYGLLPNCVLWESLGRTFIVSAAVFFGLRPVWSVPLGRICNHLMYKCD